MLAACPMVSAQDRPHVARDADGSVRLEFPTTPGLLYNLEAAPDGVTYAPTASFWTYGNGQTQSFLLHSQTLEQMLYGAYTPPPANYLYRKRAFLRIFLNEGTGSHPECNVLYSFYFLDHPDDYMDESNTALAWTWDDEYEWGLAGSPNLAPPGAPTGEGLNYGPRAFGGCTLPLPDSSLLSHRLNGGTMPLTYVENGIQWDFLVQIHPMSDLLPAEEARWGMGSSAPYALSTAALQATQSFVLAHLANTTAETPPVIDPPVPGSLAGASLRLKTYPSHLLSSFMPDDWFFSHGYDFNVSTLLSGDSDHDGLTLEQELALGLSDQNPDSDSDGYPDATDSQPLVHNFEISPLSDTDPQDGPYLSEFLAKASTTGDPDWVEIHNPANLPVNLSGWELLNHDKVWHIPEGVILAAGGYLIINCDDGNSLAPETPLHASFRLKNEGECLALRRPDGSLAHQFFAAYPHVAAGQTYGVSTDRTTVGWLEQATPGAANSAVSGVYSHRLPELATGSPLLTLTSPVAGATIAASTVNVLGQARDAYSLRSVKVVANGDTTHAVSAFLRSGRFEARSVPLVNGTNTLTVTATNLWGNSSTQSLQVTAQLPTSPQLTVVASPSAGPAPLTTTLSVQVNAPGSLLSITYDWDATGEGMTVFPLSQNGLHQVSHTFTEPGLHRPLVTVRTSLGSFTGSLSAANAIKVYRPNTILTGPGSPLEAWAQLKKRIKAQDYSQAAALFYESKRECYQTVFSDLGPDKSLKMLDDFQNLQATLSGDEVMQYVSEIQVENESLHFFINFFHHQEDGWQIFSF